VTRVINFDVIVLAGDRGPADPVAASQGVAGKVLARIAGRTLLGRVLETVAGLEGLNAVILVCSESPGYTQEFERNVPLASRGPIVAPAAGPAASLVEALRRSDGSKPVLVVTGDHPLLERAWLEDFIDDAAAANAAAVVGVADADAVARRFPQSRRTRYRFADGPSCGTNMFWFDAVRGRTVAEIWSSFEQDRKRPWRIIARLGPAILLRYITGRLRLDDATEALSRRLGVPLAAVRVAAPEAAVDVDNLEDFALAEQVLAEREAARAQ
jgi:CTP:molybdopterin cytidylyltransferase MocA